ncbi:MAG: hypothetical protein H6625_12190 [Bdellovibrionaceae bacterium]|nr:hypothetical protein [Pseudobdellovibrionaceae bacterium]
MKILILTIVLIFCFGNTSFAKKKSTKKTSFEFSEADVQGRYNSSGEGLSIVEDEKSISDIIDLRKNFKDRINKNMRLQK